MRHESEDNPCGRGMIADHPRLEGFGFFRDMVNTQQAIHEDVQVIRVKVLPGGRVIHTANIRLAQMV